MGGDEGDVMAALMRFEGDGGAGAAGEDVGDAAHLVDERQRVAGGDEEVHGAFSATRLASGAAGPAIILQAPDAEDQPCPFTTGRALVPGPFMIFTARG